ncbi:hypothetical protein LCGC14_0401200 [marine sediment metagenome]|uniref:Uncharacterized protein n=1 Tax=marine sediment metagenome TaxID=412755 RepID=A0A0F9TF01_9ZZZZ
MRQSASINSRHDTVAEVDKPFELSNSVIRDGLSELFGSWGIRPGPRAWKRAAEVLGRRARGEPYSPRYIVSIWNSNGTYRAGEPFRQALFAELARLDGANPVMLATTRGTMLLTDPDAEGAIIDSLVRFCRNPECLSRFVPNHPARHYCFVCRRPKRR